MRVVLQRNRLARTRDGMEQKRNVNQGKSKVKRDQEKRRKSHDMRREAKEWNSHVRTRVGKASICGELRCESKAMEERGNALQ